MPALIIVWKKKGTKRQHFYKKKKKKLIGHFLSERWKLGQFYQCEWWFDAECIINLPLGMTRICLCIFISLGLNHIFLKKRYFGKGGGHISSGSSNWVKVFHCHLFPWVLPIRDGHTVSFRHWWFLSRCPFIFIWDNC